jgi:hypothetical protein
MASKNRPFFMGDARISVKGGTTSRGLRALDGRTLRSLGLHDATFIDCQDPQDCTIEEFRGPVVVVARERGETEFTVEGRVAATGARRVILRLSLVRPDGTLARIGPQREASVAPGQRFSTRLAIPGDRAVAPVDRTYVVEASCEVAPPRTVQIAFVSSQSGDEFATDAPSTLRVDPATGPGLTRLAESALARMEGGVWTFRQPPPLGSAFSGEVARMEDAFGSGGVSVRRIKIKKARVQGREARDAENRRMGGLAVAMIVEWDPIAACRTVCLAQLLTGYDLRLVRAGVSRLSLRLRGPLVDGTRLDTFCKDMNVVIDRDRGTLGWTDVPKLSGLRDDILLGFTGGEERFRTGDVLTVRYSFRTFFFCSARPPQPLLAAVDWGFRMRITIAMNESDTNYEIDEESFSIKRGPAFGMAGDVAARTAEARNQIRSAQDAFDRAGTTNAQLRERLTVRGEKALAFTGLERVRGE